MQIVFLSFTMKVRLPVPVKNPRKSTYIICNKLATEIKWTRNKLWKRRIDTTGILSAYLAQQRAIFSNVLFFVKFPFGILFGFKIGWYVNNTFGLLRWALICTSVLMLYKSRNTSRLDAIKSYRCFLAICWNAKTVKTSTCASTESSVKTHTHAHTHGFLGDKALNHCGRVKVKLCTHEKEKGRTYT